MFLVCTPVVKADYGIVQVHEPESFGFTSTPPYSDSLSYTPTEGTILVATIGIGGNSAIFPVQVNSITQTGVTWTQNASSISASWVNGAFSDFQVLADIWVGVVSSGASASFSIAAQSLATGMVVNIAEYSGVTAILDDFATDTATSGTATSTGTITQTTTAPQLWIGSIITYVAGNQLAPTNGFTMYDGEKHTGLAYTTSSYLEKISHVTGSAETGTTTASSHWAGAIIALEYDGIYEYTYNFHGVYDELTGELTSDCNVTTYFTLSAADTFELTNEDTVVAFEADPTYFIFDLSPYDRYYWVDPSDVPTDIYVFNDNNTAVYTVQFNDLIGRLKTYPYVEFIYNVDGTEQIVEKLKVDVENKLIIHAVQGRTYTVKIGDYTYGDLLFGATTPITLNLRGLLFPDTIIVGYRYVRVYVTRDTGTGEIVLNYQDTKNATTSVDWYVYYQNNATLAYSNSATESEWVDTWLGSDVNTDYYAVVIIEHETYGTLEQRISLPRLYGSEISPFSLDALGSLGFDTSYLIPAFIILCSAGAFSAVNVVIGAFVVIAEAAAFAAFGWLPISVDLIVFVFALVIIFALVMARRR
jgi:hypothetical protein